MYIVFDRETESNDLNRLLHYVKKDVVSRFSKVFSIRCNKRKITIQLTNSIVRGGVNITKEYMDSSIIQNCHFVFKDEFDKMYNKGKISLDDIVINYCDTKIGSDNGVYSIILKGFITCEFKIAYVSILGNNINVKRMTSKSYKDLNALLNDNYKYHVVADNDELLNIEIYKSLSTKINELLKANDRHHEVINSNIEMMGKINTYISEL